MSRFGAPKYKQASHWIPILRLAHSKVCPKVYSYFYYLDTLPNGFINIKLMNEDIRLWWWKLWYKCLDISKHFGDAGCKLRWNFMFVVLMSLMWIVSILGVGKYSHTLCYFYCRDVNLYDLLTSTPQNIQTTVLQQANTTDNSTAPSTTTTTPTTTSTTQSTQATQSTSAAPSLPSLVDVIGVCSGVPSHASLQVMYALSGRMAGFPIYQVVGAKVK